MRTQGRTRQLLAIAILATVAGVVASLGIAAGSSGAGAPAGAFGHARSEATLSAATNQVARAARHASPLVALVPALILSLLALWFATSRPRAVPAVVRTRPVVPPPRTPALLVI